MGETIEFRLHFCGKRVAGNAILDTKNKTASAIFSARQDFLKVICFVGTTTQEQKMAQKLYYKKKAFFGTFAFNNQKIAQTLKLWVHLAVVGFSDCQEVMTAR